VVALPVAALLSAGIIWVIRPLLLRHALARPNARSSHRIPTPQGAGIAVIAATLLVAAAIVALAPADHLQIPLSLFAATLFIAIVGFADDVKSIAVLPRLVLQAAAVGIIIFSPFGDRQIGAACPLWLGRTLLLIAGLWFVNLVNFMDGLDWITAAEVVPITAALV